jgi:penicillin amidase
MVITLIILAVVLAMLASFLYLRYRFRLPLPQVGGTLEIDGLKERVDIIRDRWGVPHIYAADLEDLFFAQGYVQAQDRLWQMELNRRLANGRLSEIFGKAAFEADRFVHTVGIARAAQNDLSCLSAESRCLLVAYARGVNTCMEMHPRKLPLEFIFLGFRPEPWQPLDTLAWIKMQAWQLSANWATELLNAALVGKVGPERAARLFGGYPQDNPVILAEQKVIQAAEQVLEAFRKVETWFPAAALSGRSNSWAVRGRRSVTGKALFAYDPHLGLTMPSLWHACHLVCPDLEVTGATFPGVPGVVVGHNANITFGFTTSFADVQDLYLERFNPKDSLEYEYNGKWRKAERIVEEIRVKGEKEPRRIEIVLTRHGPTVGGLLRIESGVKNLQFALCWAGSEGSDPIAAVLRMDQSRNWAEFSAAMALWGTPSQNALYADRRGNIGYALTGKVPIRKKGIGLAPVPGWSDEYEWTDWIPWEEMPREFNPKRGYLLTANNQVVGREYPYYIGLGTTNGNRAARIEELLLAKKKHSLEDFARMQVDLLSEPGRRFAALMTSLAGGILKQGVLASDQAKAGAALELFKGWRGQMTADSAAAAVYAVSEYYAKRSIFEPWLGDLTDFYCGSGLHAFSSISFYLDYSHLVLLDILEQDDGSWLTTPDGQRRSREQVLAAALNNALHFLSRQGGANPSNWKYGGFHKAWFNHPIGNRKPFNLIFNPKPIPYGGSADTVWQCPPLRTVPPRKGSSYSAGWRHLIDFSDLEKALSVHPTGQSGHPASKHYKDLMPLWSTGQYYPMLWSRKRVEAEAEARLVLEPAGSIQM